jgi:hypothetical protein
MASKVKLKRSAVQGKVPHIDDLELGELALNTYDGKLFAEVNTGIATVVEIGSNLTNLKVSGVGTISGLTYPTSDGSAGQVIKTDGLGGLSFGDVEGGTDEHILPVMTRIAQGTGSKNDAVMVTIVAGINTVTGRFGSNVNVTENALVPFRTTVGITTHSLIETFFNTVV